MHSYGHNRGLKKKKKKYYIEGGFYNYPYAIEHTVTIQ